VFQNVGLGLRADLKLSAQDKSRVLEALERVGLGDRADAYPRALSGGQIARVAIARVLLRARPLMLLDEPFAALGPALKKEMLALVSEVATQVGATLLMISHDPEDAKCIAPQTVLVAAGRAHAPQNTMELLANPPADLAAYLGV
jgi:thiamine transport system ATP-binding protein